MKCRCCKSEDLTSVNNNVNGYSYYICNICKLEFFVSDNNIKLDHKLYENDSDYNNDLKISLDFNSLIQWNHITASKFLKGLKFESLLDFGAYNGFFVRYLLNKNIDSYGYDFNETAVATGIDFYNLDERLVTDLNKLKIKKFDCISAFDIIEHLDEPDELIFQIKKLLKHNGYLIISAPNNNMLWRPPLDNPPHHLSRFSPDTLSNYLSLNGFEIISVYEQMSTFDLIRNYFGLYFRDKNKESLKGGEFIDKKSVFILKKVLNKIRPFMCIILKPVDLLLYFFGFRYISQLVLARMINEKA